MLVCAMINPSFENTLCELSQTQKSTHDFMCMKSPEETSEPQSEQKLSGLGAGVGRGIRFCLLIV